MVSYPRDSLASCPGLCLVYVLSVFANTNQRE